MNPTAVTSLLQDYARNELSGLEGSVVAETLKFIATHDDCLLRSCVAGHLTGSAWILNPERTHTLLTHHRKLEKWLQLGGHADGDPDLLNVALREAHEESGLTEIRVLSRAIFDLDRHWIPPRKQEAAHWHFDLRFLFEANPAEPLLVSHESKELAWVSLSEVTQLNSEESMARMVRKTLRGLAPS